MNGYLNYLIEANVGLLIFLACYKLLLRRETKFGMLRMMLLSGIFVSLIFPLIHIEDAQRPSSFSISEMVPSYWLPEVTIGGTTSDEIPEAHFYFWRYTMLIYASGLIFFSSVVFFQLSKLLRIIRRAKTYRIQKLRIAESTEDKPTFSFFHFIFIGKADQLSASEKEQVIRHESVHANQWHSFDILLVNFLKIFFWFNPVINTYKKKFIELHEFEADALAVENSNIDLYCDLLARVALESADFRLANHFHSSLTVKRIQMIRTIKQKIRSWKLMAFAAIILTSFLIIACNDQILNEVKDSTITQTSMYSASVESDEEAYMQKHPDATFGYIEGQTNEIDKVINSLEDINVIEVVNTYDLSTEILDKKGVLYAKFFDTKTSTDDDKVYTVVEESASYNGGQPKLLEHLRNNINYPEVARKAGKVGTVYIQFVVNENGMLSDFKVFRGVDPDLDAEALRAVKTLPAWNPGKQNGKAVKQRYVLPITFDPNRPQDQASPLTANPYKMSVTVKKINSNGKIILTGTVVNQENQKPLPGMSIIVYGSTRGTVADAQGNFTLEVPNESGQLVFSFIGFETERRDY